MGKVTYSYACTLLDHITSILNSIIVVPLILITETIVFNLRMHTPLNLHLLVRKIKHSTFETELFPALSIDLWKPIHVNVFSTGKVIVLGKDSSTMKVEIENWLLDNLV